MNRQNVARDVDAYLSLLHSPVSASGSGAVRYAAAMYFYQQGVMTAELLEIYRRCSKFDLEDPMDLARFESIAIPSALKRTQL